MTAKAPRWLYRALLVALLLNLAVMSLGAYTRLRHAGLGCPDWPGCYGQWVLPADGHDRLQQRFPERPLEPAKAWVEMTHRYAASTLGLTILGLSLWSWRLRRCDGVPWQGLLLAAGLVLLQGAFGRWTVTLRLWPQVVTLHLLGGLLLFATLLLCALRLRRWLRGERAEGGGRRAWRSWSQVALAVLALQLSLGGWTSANYAALACPDFPGCRAVSLGSPDWRAGFDLLQAVGPDYLGGRLDHPGRVAIHLTHRLGALVTLLVVGGLGVAVLRSGEVALRRRAGLVLALLALQLALGVANVLLHLPLPLALAHHGGGVLLWGGLLILCEPLWFGRCHGG